MAGGPFHELPGAHVVLQSKGVWRQAKVFRRGDELFAGYGSGFIRLYGHGTSIPRVGVDSIDIPGGTIVTGEHGRLKLK